MKNLILVAAIIVAGIAHAQVSTEIDNYSKIKIDGNASVEILYSTDSRIQYSGSMEELNKNISKDSEKLMIEGDDKNVRIRIFTNNLKAIQASGSARVLVNGFTSLSSLNVQTTENARLDLGDIRIENLSISQNDDSTVKSTGAISKTVIRNGKLVAIK